MQEEVELELDEQLNGDHLQESISTSMVFDCEDIHTLQLVRSILDIFPAKKHLGQALVDLLLHHNAREIAERQRIQNQFEKAKQEAASETNTSASDLLNKKKVELER